MEVGEEPLAHLSRGWAWEVGEGGLHHLVAEVEAAVVEELELPHLGVVEGGRRVRLRELAVAAEGMGEIGRAHV